MRKDKEEPRINCQIFQKQEPVIKSITDKINRVNAAQEKAEFAEELQKEIDVLFSCSNYKEGSLECGSCRFIANLRKITTDVIIKAK